MKKKHMLLSSLLICGLCASVGWAGWQEVKVTASDGAADDNYGFSVAIDGDILAVGSPYDDPNDEADSGAVYLYHWNGASWDQFKKTAWTELSADALFGYSVAVSGDYVLVGAPYADPPAGTDAGAVYLFKWTGTDFVGVQWEEGHVASADDHYGWSVAIDGIWMIVGAPGHDETGKENQGAVYQYKRDSDTSWVAWRTYGTNIEAGDELGYSVAIVDPNDPNTANNPWCFGGCPHKQSYVSGGKDDAGAGYYWEFNGSSWAQNYTVASNGQVGDHYGWSAAMSAGVSGAAVGSLFGIVGTPDSNYSAVDDGKAYIYLYRISDKKWLQYQWSDLESADRITENHFGTSVSMSSVYAACGVPYADDPNDSGAVVVTNMAGGVDAYPWGQADLKASDAATDDNFGYSVAASRNGESRIAVGSPNDDDNGSNSGSVYVYTYSTGTLSLTAPAGGERIPQDYPFEITWTSSPGIAEIQIELSTDNGGFWSVIESQAENTGSFYYAFGTVSDQCLLRISDAFDATVYSEMAVPFEVYVCSAALTADLTGDCFVDLGDFANFASQWLMSGEL